jgi:hypothetical protein
LGSRSKGECLLTLFFAAQAESLWDEALPVEVRELPEELAALDRLLCEPEPLAPIAAHWWREVAQTRRAALTEADRRSRSRASSAIESFIRLMVLKQRYR